MNKIFEMNERRFGDLQEVKNMLVEISECLDKYQTKKAKEKLMEASKTLSVCMTLMVKEPKVEMSTLEGDLYGGSPETEDDFAFMQSALQIFGEDYQKNQERIDESGLY